jgi:2-succinyl-5-enolpyruvyl-6-hydroxy-3-cyclohexene-1-carboxylate synthase
MTETNQQPNHGDIALACTSLLIDELTRGGVTHARVSPGSRSTPLALAASRHPGMNVHIHLDERSAAFVAMGIARASGRPAAVICTSGTAVANWLPAVVEASMSRVPLLLLSADRPPDLRHTGANQTIDQIEIFGGYVRWFVDADLPEVRGDASRYWRSLGERAVAAADGPPAGPVHLNLPFREPLLPSGASVDLGDAACADVPSSENGAMQDPSPSEREVADLARMVGSSPRGIIVATGTRAPLNHSLAALTAAAGWPLIAEPTSGLRLPDVSLSSGTLLAGNEAFRSAHVPDMVLQIGAAPTSRAMLTLVGEAKRLVIVDPDEVIADPARHAEWTLSCDPNVLVDAITKHLENTARKTWLAEWRAADTSVRAAVDALIDSWDEPFEGRIARDVAATLPDGATLVVASSMPVRDLDAYMASRTGLRVIANRGASGIDGTVSTAVGVATSTSTPTWALLGDLALLHDSSALLWAATRIRGLTLVVVNNRGGGIFAMLPQAGLDARERDLFETPHDVDIAALARASGAAYRAVVRAADLHDAVLEPTTAGLRIVEVRSEMRSNAERHVAVAATVAAAITALDEAEANRA